LRVLLVRLRQIGDVVFTTPAIRALRTRFPAAHVSYLVEPAAQPIVFGNPNIDEVIVAERGVGAQIALIRRLRAARFDLVIDFHGGPRASILTWLSGARTRIGYQVAGRSWMYTTRVPRPRGLRPRHSVENQWDLLAPLDIPAPTRERLPVEMAASPAARETVGARIAAAGVGGGTRLVIMHVSAGNPFRLWPEESFAEVAAALAAQEDLSVVVTSGPSDRDAAARVIAKARSRLGSRSDRILNCGEFSLEELRALADRSALYIGGDSGPLHVAATSRVPIVALYGPTLPARSAPWRDPRLAAVALETPDLMCRPCDQRTCVPGDFRCLTWIRPQQVVEAASRLLASAEPP
jgi:predicted lipopolysaccharide heptosyltransferase III